MSYILKRGFITAYEAFTDLGVSQLATRIFELKELGYRFRKERVEYTKSDGSPSHFDKYYLVLEGQQELPLA